MPASKTKIKQKAKLEVAEDATVPETVEAVVEYLKERHGHLSDEQLAERTAEVQRSLREIEADLGTANEGLQDALLKDEAEIDPDALDEPVVGKHYQRERERLSKLIPKRWRLQRTLVELELTARLRRNAAAAEESRKLAAEIAPLEEEKRQLELKIIDLQNSGKLRCLPSARTRSRSYGCRGGPLAAPRPRELGQADWPRVGALFRRAPSLPGLPAPPCSADR